MKPLPMVKPAVNALVVSWSSTVVIPRLARRLRRGGAARRASHREASDCWCCRSAG